MVPRRVVLMPPHGGASCGGDKEALHSLVVGRLSYSLCQELVGPELWAGYVKEQDAAMGWLGLEINLEREKPRNAEATRESNARSVREAIGFGVRVRGAAPSLASLLDGELLMAYVEFLQLRGNKPSSTQKHLFGIAAFIKVLETPTGR